MIKDALRETEIRMKGAISALESDLARIRTGRATPALVEHIPVDYYNTPTPLIQLAGISVPEPRMLLIQPYDPNVLKDIERALLVSDLGLTPTNDGKNIRLSLPIPTEERRQDLVKVVRNRVEQARIAVRNIRRDVNRDLKEFEGEKMISENELHLGEEQVQELTDQHIDSINSIGERKEKEITEI